MNEFQILLRKVSALHESKIEKILIEEQPDLEKFLDYTQEVLNMERFHSNNEKSIFHPVYKPVAELNITQIQSVQSVILKLMNNNHGSIEQRKYHRERALAHNFKVSAKKAKPLEREEMRAIAGKNYEKAFDSLNQVSTTYKPATSAEIIKAMEFLSDCPEAIKLAEKTLSTMELKS